MTIFQERRTFAQCDECGDELGPDRGTPREMRETLKTLGWIRERSGIQGSPLRDICPDCQVHRKNLGNLLPGT